LGAARVGNSGGSESAAGDFSASSARRSVRTLANFYACCFDCGGSSFWFGARAEDSAAESAGNIERERPRRKRHAAPGAGHVRRGGNGHGSGAADRGRTDDSQLTGALEW